MEIMMARSWMERWLEVHTTATSREIDDVAEKSRKRASRFPLPVGSAYSLLEKTVDQFGPLLATGVPKAAHDLTDDQFDDFEVAVQHHRVALVRGMYMLLRQPALENVYPDETPVNPAHPLDARMGKIRASTSHTKSQFDIIVIGSGAGGAPVASSMAARGHSVAIIEAGGMVPAQSVPDAIEKHYLNQAMVGAANKGGMVLVMAGQGVGGTTVINSGTSFSPRPERLEQWTQMTGVDMASALDPWLKEVHHRIGVSAGGRDLMDGSSKAVERGFAIMGRETFILPRNAPQCEGDARCCFGCPTGAKQSTDRAFLPDAVDNGAALFIKTRATDIRELPDGVEVTVHAPDGRRVLRAKHLVIAAGALATPHLVRSNKLGDKWSECGDNLKVHPATKIFALMPEALPHGGVPQGVGYRPPELPHITFEGIHTPAAAASVLIPTAGRRHKWWMDRYDRLASFGLMCRDRTTGSVRGVGVTRRLEYALHPQDAHDMGAGVLMMAEAMFHAGAEKVLLPLGSNCEVNSLEELKTRKPSEFTPSQLMTSGFHPQGTAGVGRVVDADLRVSGTQRIWISDASVLPDSPGVNPQVSIMAFGLRLGDHLASLLGSTATLHRIHTHAIGAK
jgi:choline dehydrogenase-like flavoprotein